MVRIQEEEETCLWKDDTLGLGCERSGAERVGRGLGVKEGRAGGRAVPASSERPGQASRLLLWTASPFSGLCLMTQF